MDAAKRRVARICRVEVIADAPVASVWQVVADATRTPEPRVPPRHLAGRSP